MASNEVGNTRAQRRPGAFPDRRDEVKIYDAPLPIYRGCITVAAKMRPPTATSFGDQSARLHRKSGPSPLCSGCQLQKCIKTMGQQLDESKVEAPEISHRTEAVTRMHAATRTRRWQRSPDRRTAGSEFDHVQGPPRIINTYLRPSESPLRIQAWSRMTDAQTMQLRVWKHLKRLTSPIHPEMESHEDIQLCGEGSRQ